MASFLDQQYKFAPYVETTPVEAMVKVGMLKQQQYDEGVQKINSWIDETAALPVMRDIDKQYLQSSLNSLTSDLKRVAGADFSNQQLVSSVGGATKRISRDPNILAAVYSTKKHQDNLEIMEAARQKGELTPDNEYNYTKSFNRYYTSGTLGEKFTGEYTPWFDVDKYTRETFNALKPEGYTYDQVFQTDSEGRIIRDKNNTPIYSPTMKRLKKEGLFPETVTATLSQIMSDPRVARQLNITGEYTYKNYTPQQLQGLVDVERNNVITAYEEKLSELTLRKTMGENVDTQMEALDSTLEKVRYNYEDYRNLALTNPEAVAGKIYKDGVENRYTKMYGHSVTEETVHDNPGYIREFERLKEANNQYWKAKEFNQKVQEHADNIQMRQLELAQKIEAANKRGTGRTTTKTPKPGEPGYTPESFQADQSAALDLNNVFENDYAEAAANDLLSTNAFIWETSFASNPKNKALLDRYTSGPNAIGRDAAIQKILNDTAKLNKESPESFRARWAVKAQQAMLKPSDKVPPNVQDAYNNYTSNRRIFENVNAFKTGTLDKVEGQGYTAEDFEKMNLLDIKPQTVTIPGGFLGTPTTVNLDKQDIIDLALYKKAYLPTAGIGEDPVIKDRAKSAKARLIAKYGDTGQLLIDEVMIPNLSDLRKTPASALIRTGLEMFQPQNIYTTGSILKKHLNLPTAIDDVYNMLTDVNYNKILTKKAELIHQRYRMEPNRSINLLTGDTETDRSTLSDLRTFAGAATEGQKMNEAPNFSTFGEALAGDDISLEARVIVEGGNPKVKVNVYGKDATLKGDMYLTPDQALNFGIDVQGMYESKEIASLRTFIDNSPNNQTSRGVIGEKSTYVNDAYFVEKDFPNLKGSNYKAKANMILQNGMYYPYIFVADKQGRSVVKPLPGYPDLAQAVSGMKVAVTPQLAEMFLIGK